MVHASSRQITLKPGETWYIDCDGDGPELPRGVQVVSDGTNDHTCTCGVDKVGQGKHSDWCAKYEKEQSDGES